MGIYLPNMEMPKKDGSWVTLRVFPDGKCFLYSWCEIDFDFMEYLTAVPVPPHGRLIDADELLQSHSVSDGIYFPDAYIPATAIKAAPTIIPAEEGE